MGAALATVALPIGLQASAAQAGTQAQTDPQASSPAGVIYQIPLDSARRNAAPVLSVGSRSGSHGGGQGVTGAAGDPSSIHSENGFGSSAQVPGLSRSALGIGAGTAAAHPGGSTFPTFLLIGLVSIAAIAAGVLATGAKRRRREGPDDHRTDDPA